MKRVKQRVKRRKRKGGGSTNEEGDTSAGMEVGRKKVGKGSGGGGGTGKGKVRTDGSQAKQDADAT